MDRVTCLKSTRDAILSRYPEAAADPVLWRALQYLLFASRIDRSTRRLRVDEAGIEMIVGAPIYGTSTRKGAFKSGRQVLEYVRDNMLPGFRWSGYSQNQHPRTVISDGIDPALKKIVDQDLSSSITGSSERVFIDTGEKYSPAKQRKLKQDWLSEAKRLSAGSPSIATTYVLQGLNDDSIRPLNGFTPGFAACICDAFGY